MQPSSKRSGAPINIMWMQSPDDFMTREVPFSRVPDLTARVTIERVARVESSALRSVDAIMDAVKDGFRQEVRRRERA